MMALTFQKRRPIANLIANRQQVFNLLLKANRGGVLRLQKCTRQLPAQSS